jgi:hypothetical protein
MATTYRPNCGQHACIRDQLTALLEPDSSIVDRLLLVACVVAQTCGSLAAGDLRRCATSLFGVRAESELTGAFITAYQNERDRMAGRRQMEKYRAGWVSTIHPGPRAKKHEIVG